jgi:hypothetical protein
MDNNIGVALIIGLTIGTSIFVYDSEKFNKIQKIFLLICLIFPPLQWLSILIILGINKYREKNSTENIEFKNVHKPANTIDDKINSLRELKDKEILTEEEYRQKVNKLKNSKLESEIKLSDDYQKLKTLYNDEILTKEEFESKFEILKSKFYSKNNFDNQEKKSNNGSDFAVTEEFSEGYYVIMDNDMNYGFADLSYEKVIDTIYEYANSFKEGLALVRLNNQFGFIDKDGKEVIPFIYDNAYSYENGKAKVQKGKESFYINKNGEKH